MRSAFASVDGREIVLLFFDDPCLLRPPRGNKACQKEELNGFLLSQSDFLAQSISVGKGETAGRPEPPPKKLSRGTVIIILGAPHLHACNDHRTPRRQRAQPQLDPELPPMLATPIPPFRSPICKRHRMLGATTTAVQFLCAINAKKARRLEGADVVKRFRRSDPACH
jgi:hypothetical protein